MDNKKRKRLTSIKEKIDICKCDIEALSTSLEEVLDEERDVNANLEEYFPNSERYDISCSAVDAMESAVSSISDAVDDLESAISYLEEAVE